MSDEMLSVAQLKRRADARAAFEWLDEKGQKVVGAPKPAPSFDEARKKKAAKVQALKAKIEQLVGDGTIGMMAQRRTASVDSTPKTKTTRKQMTTGCKEPGCDGRVHYHARRLTGTGLTGEKPQIGRGPVSVFGQCVKCGNTSQVHTHNATSSEMESAEDDAMMERIAQMTKNPVRKSWASLYERLLKADAVHGPTAMAMQAATPPAMDFDHDRRRIKQSVRKLMGDKYKFAPATKAPTPSSPAASVGAVKPVNTAMSMAKALESDDPMAEYHRLNGHLKEISKEIASRGEFTPSHDAAAVMLAHGTDQLLRAREHHARMQSGGLNRADGMRALLGMKTTHMVHLTQADAYLRSARFLAVKGDRELANAGRLTLSAFNEGPIAADPSNRVNLAVGKAYFQAARAGRIAGMAQRWKETWHKQAGTTPAATPAPESVSTRAPVTTSTPSPAPASASKPADSGPLPEAAPAKPSLLSRIVARGRVPTS